jgi:sugar lactone lactonase YvrE
MTPEYYIFLSGPTDNTVKVADPNGKFLGNIVTSGSGGLFGTDGLEINSDGDLLVGTVLGENVLRYDGRTGTFLGEFIAPNSGGFADPNRQTGLDTVTQIKFGPDGNLYVSNFISFDGFDPATREPIFSTNPRESVDNILVFDPNGNFITQYDFPIQGPATPLGIEFVGNKLIVAARSHNTIYQFEDITSANQSQPNLLSAFINGNDPNIPLNGPAGLLVASDGNIYTTSLDSQQIQVYNANDGSFIEIFVDQTNEKGLIGPSALLETPNGVQTPSGETELIVTGFTSLNAGRIDFEGDDAGNVLDIFIPVGGNNTWGFGKNEGAIIVTPEMIGGRLILPSLYVSNVNNTFGTGPVVNINLDNNGNITSVSPNFEPGVYYSSILEYDANTGEFLGEFVPKGSAFQDGIFFSSGITFKDNILYANDQGFQVDSGVTNPADSLYGRILTFDATTGQFLGEFISGSELTANGLNFPEDLLFGPDGDLYISGLGGGGVQKFDGTTGAYEETIIKTNPFTGKDLIAAGLNFGTDGNLYISSVLNDNSILRYNLDTKTIDQFIPPEIAPQIPSGSTFTPDGSLFLDATFVSVDGSPVGIQQYDAGTGEDRGFFVNPDNNGGIQSVSRMRFDNNGNLYLSDFNGSQIAKFDSQGSPVDGGIFVAAGVGGLNNPGGIAFHPSSLKNQISPSPMYRFRNTSYQTGTYLFTGEEEKDSILANPDLNQTFVLEGPAFEVSFEAVEGLLPFYRLRSMEIPGTYLFAGQEEYNSIFAENSVQKDKWVKEGLDSNGNDVPDFYVYGADSNQGQLFNRFRNQEDGGYLFAGTQESENILNNPSLANIFINEGPAFKALV